MYLGQAQAISKNRYLYLYLKILINLSPGSSGLGWKTHAYIDFVVGGGVAAIVLNELLLELRGCWKLVYQYGL